MIQCYNASMIQYYNASMIQCYNAIMKNARMLESMLLS